MCHKSLLPHQFPQASHTSIKSKPKPLKNGVNAHDGFLPNCHEPPHVIIRPLDDKFSRNGRLSRSAPEALHEILAARAEKPYLSNTMSVGENLKPSSLWILHPVSVIVDTALLSTHVIVTPVSDVKFVY